MFIHALEEHMPSPPPYASLHSIFPCSCILSHHIFFHFPILGMGHLDSFETWSLALHFLLPYHLAPHILSPFLSSTNSHCFSSMYHTLTLPCHWFHPIHYISHSFNPFTLSILSRIRPINSILSHIQSHSSIHSNQIHLSSISINFPFF